MTTNKQLITTAHIGKKAYKKRGFYSGLIGVVVESDSGISDFALDFRGNGRVGIRYIDDVEFVEQ